MISLKNIGKKAIVTLAMLIVLKGNVLSNSSKPIDINQIYLTSCVNNEICSTESKDVTLENKVKLNLVVEASQDGKKLYFSNIDNIKINGSKINSSFIKQWNAKDTLIRWFKVESQKNNYDNGGNENFHWDKIKYKETLIDNGNKWVLQADGSPTDKSKDINDGLGTMRYKVEVRYNGKKISSPGKESTNSKGIEDKVHRISFRKDNSFVGWLTSYFNLPYIYASSGKNNKQIKQ